MPIDYGRLVSGLTTLARIVTGSPGLPSLQSLITTAQEATGAKAATFIEYRGDMGRIVLATGAMLSSLGQPIGPEYAHLRNRPPDTGLRRIDQIPPELAARPLRQGLVTLTSAKVYRGGTPVGAFHLYFDTHEVDDLKGVMSIVELTAQAARHIFQPPVAASIASVADTEDRALFLAVAGHELRTPVTVVKGYASMLADRWDALDEANRREASRVLMLRADELARLVDRMLRASTGESEAGWLVRTVPFDPVEALAHTAEDLPMDLRRAVRVHVPRELPMAIGDPSLLTSVVAELVTNALRATPQPSAVRDAQPSVDLRAGADAETVYIQVRDRGVGIDPAQAEIAFERFWRAQRNGDGRPGAGLGLYLVRRLVERQMGWVSLRPRDGGGTVAEVRLLRADGHGRRTTLGEA
jgi:signal transduction histidine kinase